MCLCVARACRHHLSSVHPYRVGVQSEPDCSSPSYIHTYHGPCQNHRLGKYGPGLLPPSSHSVTTPPVRKRHQSITGGAYRWMRTSLPRRPTRGLLATLRFRVPESMAPLGEEAGIGALQQRFSVITASFIPERTNVAASRTSRPRTRAAWILHMQGVTGGIPVVEGRGGNGMRHMRRRKLPRKRNTQSRLWRRVSASKTVCRP